MADIRLLKIIAEETGPRGSADGETVKRRYGAGFDDAFVGAVREGMIASEGEYGTITLSPAGRREAGLR